jgi:hypothetical protein
VETMARQRDSHRRIIEKKRQEAERKEKRWQ